MSVKKAIFLYNLTPYALQPWLDAGYECYSFDGQHPNGVTNEGNWYKIGTWLDRNEETIQKITEICGKDVSFVGGFPACTDLAVSGAAHFAKKRLANPDFQKIAIERAKLVEDIGNYYNCPWFLENPVSVMSTQWRKPNYSFHPYEYGGYLPENDVHPEYPDYINPRDSYTKKTCLWTGNGFIMPPIKPVYVSPGYSTQHLKLGGKSIKTKNIRSATPRGFANALFLANGK